MEWAQVAVEGVISGAVVLLGVITAAILDRTRTRRRAVEVAFQSLAIPLNYTLAGLVDPKAPKDIHSDCYQHFNRAHELLVEIQLQARRFRRAARVREAARRLGVVLLTANAIALIEKRRVSQQVLTEADIQPLRAAIFGDRSVPADGAYEPEFWELKAKLEE